MRLPVIVSLIMLFSSTTIRSEDKPESRVKEATEAFVKALNSKDVEGVLKVVEVPFLLPDIKASAPNLERLEKTEALSDVLKEIFKEKFTFPTTIGEIQKLSELKKKLKDSPEADEPMVKKILEVGGDDSYLVSLIDDKKEKAGLLLVRVKKDTSKVIGILPVTGAGSAKQP